MESEIYHAGNNWRHDASDASKSGAEANWRTSWAGRKQFGSVGENDIEVAGSEEFTDEGTRHLVYWGLCFIKSYLNSSINVLLLNSLTKWIHSHLSYKRNQVLHLTRLRLIYQIFKFSKVSIWYFSHSNQVRIHSTELQNLSENSCGKTIVTSWSITSSSLQCSTEESWRDSWIFIWYSSTITWRN